MTDQVHSFVSRCMFLVWFALLVFEPGVSAHCSEFDSSLEIHVDWWNISPYSYRERKKNGNYTYSGKDVFVLNVTKHSITHISFKIIADMNVYVYCSGSFCTRYRSKTSFNM